MAGFANSFTAGEISEDAWDRTDIQPVSKGCEEAINYVVRIAGPLGKRRGFWRLNDVLGSAKSRLIPFRRSIDDALMLEFGDGLVRVWNNDGTVLATFASPYSAAQLDGLRFHQVNDVIYLRHRDGLPPRTLDRITNTSWAFALESFPDGPWRPENADKTFTLTIAGAGEVDANPQSGGGTIFVGAAVTLTASAPLFQAGHVGSVWRLRAGVGSPSVKAWSAGYRSELGYYCVSSGRVYSCAVKSNHDETITNPPTQTEGLQSDGGNTWDYRHDGAGIVEITGYSNPTTVTGVVLKALPFRAGTQTSYFAEGAYSDLRGWPRMWPAMREERLVEGATAGNLDFLDLTQTAGFTPTTESFTPGLGTGTIVATDAVRRRVGDDGAELIWARDPGYLIVGSASGEYLVAGSVLDQAIAPASVVVKPLTSYGSADVAPVKAHGGIIAVARGGQTLFELGVDANQNAADDDLTVLAQDIVRRGVAQLAWLGQPENTLWLRLADGGLAVMVYHKKQQVRGFCRVTLGGGFICDDMAVLPGPGRRDTLWLQVSRVKNAATQRAVWMLSRPEDALYMDGSAFWNGAPVTSVGGISVYDGEMVLALADGEQLPAIEVAGGLAHLGRSASLVLVGLPYTARFKSLRLDRSLGGSLNRQQRLTACTVSLKTALASVACDGFEGELVAPRDSTDVPAAMSRRAFKSVTLKGDTDRDPRVVIEDATAYDGVIYSLSPVVNVGG